MLMKKQIISLRTILLIVFLSAWLIPIGFLSWFIFHDYQKAYLEKTGNLVNNSVEVSGAVLTADIDEAILKIWKPSYEGVWESEYRRYKMGIKSKNEYLTALRASLTSRYYMDEQMARYALYLPEDEMPSCYAGKNGYSWEDYIEKVQPLVHHISERNDSRVEILVVDNQVYLIRNLLTAKDNEKYGTLVLGLDVRRLLEELPVDNEQDVLVAFGQGEYLTLGGSEEINEAREKLYGKLIRMAEYSDSNAQVFYAVQGGYAGYLYSYRCDDYSMTVFYPLPRQELYEGIVRLNITLIVILCCMVPFALFTGYILTVHISRPMGELMGGAQRLRDGDFGYIVDKKCAKNMDFLELVDSFNEMSARVEYYFNTVYEEKLATKDARLAALQAQINPHFLNNTLEMMNWQARMNGDLETSRMIEALGIVLDFSMSRNNDRTVSLKEELRCADAFLYIMSMRFGQRLKVEKLVDPALYYLQVPQLTLQPLLENAIKHGIEKLGSGTIWVNIYGQQKEVCIDVINTSRQMGEQEIAHINGIIQGEQEIDRSKPGAHRSIGIYNVNRRVQLIYGEKYGLKVFLEGENHFVSRIIIPLPDGREEEET